MILPLISALVLKQHKHIIKYGSKEIAQNATKILVTSIVFFLLFIFCPHPPIYNDQRTQT